MTSFIYIVKLINSKYFVSFQQSLTDFTDINYEGMPAMELIQIIELEETNNNNIDKIVKEYMIKYGIDKVRGGSYNKKKLDDLEIQILEYEFSFLQIQANNNIDNNNIDNIDIISNICDTIHDYQDKINSTNITIDIEELLKNNKIYTELNNRINFLDTHIDNYIYKGSVKNGCHEIFEKLNKEKREINTKLAHNTIPYSHYVLVNDKIIINNCYKSYCRFNNIEPKIYHNFEIQYYLTKMYYNEQKELLKEFIDKNGLLEDNMKKLTALHKMKFKLYNNK
jgi:hypothetical protein